MYVISDSGNVVFVNSNKPLSELMHINQQHTDAMSILEMMFCLSFKAKRSYCNDKGLHNQNNNPKFASSPLSTSGPLFTLMHIYVITYACPDLI